MIMKDISGKKSFSDENWLVSCFECNKEVDQQLNYGCAKGYVLFRGFTNLSLLNNLGYNDRE